MNTAPYYTKTRNLTRAEAFRVWSILVDHCGAKESGRLHFIDFVTSQPWINFRFGGRLGSGTIWCDLRVTCCRNDETETRLKIRKEVNKTLRTLKRTLEI